MPPPGAVCPAMVRLPEFARIVLCGWMTPPTRKTQVRGPEVCTQARSEPVPESLRFVTSITTPPRPPREAAPPPCAPGNAATTPGGGGAAAVTVIVAVVVFELSESLVAVAVSVVAEDGAT